MKKLVIILFSIFLIWSFVNAYTTEQRLQWYEWAYKNWLTTQTLQSARLDWYITRQALAKMLVVFSNMIWLNEKNIICSFSDYDDIVIDLKPYVLKVCRLGLMWVNNKLFSPMDYVSKAQFASILSRALWWNKYNWWEPYYIKHVDVLKSYWIIEDTDTLMSSYQRRWDIMYMLKKAYNLKLLLGNSEYENIIQELVKYLQKGKELKDKWAGQNNKNMMRYWVFIEWKAQEILETYLDGEIIESSTWTSLKSQFDEYLEKSNYTIIQEANEYLQKGKELKDKWAGQNNKNMMRYWLFIEWKAQEILDALKKGETIDSSTWTTLKSQFEEYLKKGNNV